MNTSGAPPSRRLGVLFAAAGVVLVATTFGYALVKIAMPSQYGRYLTWIAGRSLGLAAYATLAGLVALGVWTRHPWRLRRKVLHPETVLRAHAALAAATVGLLAGHVVSLVLDRYAGVGWRGILVPGAATYRSGAVALGVVAMYLLVMVSATASLAGRMTGRTWLPVHRVAVVTFALVWVHGVLAGTDTPRLRILYAASGLLVAGLVGTRYGARRAQGDGKAERAILAVPRPLDGTGREAARP